MERIIFVIEYKNKVKQAKHEKDMETRRRLMLELAVLHRVIRTIDYMGGMIEMFRLKNGVRVLRQEIFRTRKAHWYVIQEDGTFLSANEAEVLETVYVRDLTMD